MRRCISLFLAAFLLLPLTLAGAEASLSSVPIAVAIEGARGQTYDKPVCSLPQPCTVPVTITQHLNDGSTNTFTIYPTVLTVVYRYYVTIQNGKSIGGYVLDGSYPNHTLEPDSSMTHELNATAVQFSDPVSRSVVGNGDTYTVRIAGGGLDITYNSVIHYAPDGSVMPQFTQRDTVRRTYYYSLTAPTPD